METTIQTAARLRVFARPKNPFATPQSKITGTAASNYIRIFQNLIPGVLYGGKGLENIPLCTRRKDLIALMKNRASSFENSLFSLMFENGEYQLAVPRDLQLHLTNDYPLTCNFLRYDPKRGVNIPISLNYINQNLCVGIKRGGNFNQLKRFVWVHVRGDVIPHSIPIDIQNLAVGDKILWSDLKLPDTIKLMKSNNQPQDLLLCNVKLKYSVMKQLKAEKRLLKESKKSIKK